MAGKLVISNHALLCWLQRTGALDVEQLRELLSGSLQRAFDAAGTLEAGRYSILADGLVYLIDGGTLVTVLEETTGSRVAVHRHTGG